MQKTAKNDQEAIAGELTASFSKDIIWTLSDKSTWTLNQRMGMNVLFISFTMSIFGTGSINMLIWKRALTFNGTAMRCVNNVWYVTFVKFTWIRHFSNCGRCLLVPWWWWIHAFPDLLVPSRRLDRGRSHPLCSNVGKRYTRAIRNGRRMCP